MPKFLNQQFFGVEIFFFSFFMLRFVGVFFFVAFNTRTASGLACKKAAELLWISQVLGMQSSLAELREASAQLPPYLSKGHGCWPRREAAAPGQGGFPNRLPVSPVPLISVT